MKPTFLHCYFDKRLKYSEINFVQVNRILIGLFKEPVNNCREGEELQNGKIILGNIGNLFVKCMRHVTKGHFYPLLEISDYYVMYRQRAQSVL